MSKKTGKKKPALLVKGTLDITRSGMGYVIAEGREKDVLIRPQDFNKAFHGDTVRVKLKDSNGRRVEGVVEEVVEKTKEEVFTLLKQTLRPEFINRIDEIVLFQPLNIKEIGKIVQYQIRGFNEMLEKRGIMMTATEDALTYITNKGYDPSFGARPLKRLLQQEVLNKLSKEILAGHVQDGDRITLDYFDASGLVFRPTVK